MAGFLADQWERALTFVLMSASQDPLLDFRGSILRSTTQRQPSSKRTVAQDRRAAAKRRAMRRAKRLGHA